MNNFGNTAQRLFSSVSIALLLSLAELLTACQTKSRSIATPQGGPMMPQSLPQQPTVWVRGDVKNQIIPWNEDLTLSRAIVAADYQSSFDPRSIIVTRQGQVYRISPRDLLRGRDDPLLQPGDVIEIQR